MGDAPAVRSGDRLPDYHGLFDFQNANAFHRALMQSAEIREKNGRGGQPVGVMIQVRDSRDEEWENFEWFSEPGEYSPSPVKEEDPLEMPSQRYLLDCCRRAEAKMARGVARAPIT